MSANPDDILVFRTNVRSPKDVKRISPVLDDLCGTTGKWNFDLEDCDAILRVIMPGIRPRAIIWQMQERGFLCQELEDVIPPLILSGNHRAREEAAPVASHASPAC